MNLDQAIENEHDDELDGYSDGYAVLSGLPHLLLAVGAVVVVALLLRLFA